METLCESSLLLGSSIVIVVVFLLLTSGNIPISGDEATLFKEDLGATGTGPKGTSGALDFDASLFWDCRAASKNLFCG